MSPTNDRWTISAANDHGKKVRARQKCETAGNKTTSAHAGTKDTTQQYNMVCVFQELKSMNKNGVNFKERRNEYGRAMGGVGTMKHCATPDISCGV